jgi:hypothetical protein
MRWYVGCSPSLTAMRKLETALPLVAVWRSTGSATRRPAMVTCSAWSAGWSAGAASTGSGAVAVVVDFLRAI